MTEPVSDTPALDPITAGRPFIVYGTGSSADRLIEARGLDPARMRFASSTGEGSFHGQEIAPVSALNALGEMEIIVASAFLTPILETLQAHDVAGRRIWWYMHDQDRLIHFDALGVTPVRTDTLYAVYDLAMNPSTFDCTTYAARADVERQRRGFDVLQFIIVPSAIQGGRPGDLERTGGLESVMWRRSYLLDAVFRLVPATRGVATLACREDVMNLIPPGAACFPADYDPARPTDEHASKASYDGLRDGFEARVLKAPAKAVTFVTRFLAPELRGRKLLTLTLREYGFEPARNNDMDAWGAFLNSLDPDQYFVVIIRDTDWIYTPMPPALEGFTDLPLASVDVNFRLALYEAAYLNLTVTTGPAELLYYSKIARYLMFKLIVPQYEVATPRFQLERNGLHIGDNFPLAGPFQKFIWEPDTLDVIRAEFDAMVEKIEAA